MTSKTTNYHIRNWPQYNEALKSLKSITFWFSEDEKRKAIAAQERAEHEADIAEARRLVSLATQLANKHLFTDAFHVALAAYKKTDPKPLETYRVFQAIFDEGIGKPFCSI